MLKHMLHVLSIVYYDNICEIYAITIFRLFYFIYTATYITLFLTFLQI
jgi:hypothetical protein